MIKIRNRQHILSSRVIAFIDRHPSPLRGGGWGGVASTRPLSNLTLALTIAAALAGCSPKAPVTRTPVYHDGTPTNRSSVQSWELNREPFYTQPGVNGGTHVAAPALPRSQRGFEPYDPLADRVYQAIGMTHIDVKYITVTAKHGEVVLIGTVDNAKELQKTLDATAHVPGVEHIRNQLAIAAEE